MNQTDFALSAGLDASKMSKSLAGVRRFTSSDLANIAEVGRVTVDWLLTGADVSRTIAARASNDGALQGVAQAVDRASTYAQARNDLKFLGVGGSGQPELPTAWQTGSRVVEGERLAQWALTAMEMPPAASSVAFAEQIESVFGIDVAIVNLDPGFDGLAWCDPGARVILVSTHPVPTRQRYTLAHELGHVLSGDDQQLHVDTSISRPARRNESEMRANAFAANFLMSGIALRQAFAELDQTSPISDQDFSKLVMKFSVSASALAFRALNLKLIDSVTHERLSRLRTWECAELAGEADEFARRVDESESERLPVNLLRDSLRAYQEGKATIRPLANLFGVSPELLRVTLQGVVGDQMPAAVNANSEGEALHFVP